MKWLSLLLTAASLVPAQTSGKRGPHPTNLHRRIETILASLPAAQRAFWGVRVVQASTGTPLFETNGRRLFLPASNAKLFTTAFALMRLGPDYRFETTVRSDEPPGPNGRLAGDLRLIGGGDPMLSAREVPYHKGHSATGNPLQAIETLADQIYASGVRSIAGDIVGDDTAYVWEPYPEGWAQDDLVWDYGAPVSALTVNDNVFTLRLRAAGRLASVILSPPMEFYSIDNRVRAGPGLPAKVQVERLPGSRQLRLWGTLGSDPASETQMLLAIDDPALYAARAFADALTRRGIVVAGRPAARHRWANEAPEQGGMRLDVAAGAGAQGGVVLARRTSPPLIELLRVIDKVSQNLHAEIVLREVGRVRRGVGTREAALDEERKFLGEAGIGSDEYHFADASGLSGGDLVAPEAVVKLLQYMYRTPLRDAWISLLPIGGEDGTLAGRFGGVSAARRIHAKTGSLSQAAALSGYIESRTRGMLTFSILANNFNAPGSDIRGVIDRIALALAE
jgi:D-alanyl-D-alanine carboxypeptidase/D-alanyl-D-alanine-endopeptidase (penicillin-binding protein 4)